MSSNWRTLGELAAVVSVVFSLLFVGYELRLSRTVAYTDSLAANEGSIANFRSLVVAQADLWQRGCAGEEMTPGERLIFIQLATSFHEMYFYLFRRTQQDVLTANPVIYAEAVARNMYHFPGLELALREIFAKASTRPDFWIVEIEQSLQTISDSEQKGTWDVSFCGV